MILALACCYMRTFVSKPLRGPCLITWMNVMPINEGPLHDTLLVHEVRARSRCFAQSLWASALLQLRQGCAQSSSHKPSL